MSDEASPRPWRVKQSPIGSNAWIVSGETFVASASRHSDAALIVAAVNERDRLLAAMKAIEDLCKVLDRTDLWEAREECLDDAIYYIREEARAVIGEEKE